VPIWVPNSFVKLEAVKGKMLIVPEGVPKDLIQELEACQKQLRILIANYQILRDRSKVNPNDKVVAVQIDQIEKLILQYNERQVCSYSVIQVGSLY